MKCLLFVFTLIAAPYLLATSLSSPKAVRIVSGCFTVNNKRICPPEIRQLVMHEDVFLLQGDNIINSIQCQSHQHAQVPGHSVHCIGQPGGHQQVVPPHGNQGIGGQHPNPVGGQPGVGKIVVP